MNTINSKPNVIFLSRVWYSKLFSKLTLTRFNAYHICINKKEKENILAKHGNVIGCFEEEFEELPMDYETPNDMLRNGFYSDRFLGNLSIGERKIIQSKLFYFFDKHIKSIPFLYGIHETIAIEVDEIFSYVVKKNNITDMTFIHSIIDNHFIWKPNPYNSSIANIINKISITDKEKKKAKDYIQKNEK